jgi:hypothetical protein
MNADKQIEIYRELDEKIMQVTTSKRNDYASDFDVLSNFKGVAEAAKALGIDITDSSQYALFMVILKIKRITNLINSKKTPNNESIEDSFLDGINYFKLAYCCFKDK